MTSTTSRRAILAGAATLPALAVPALASSLTPDPIFELITEAERSWHAWDRGSDELEGAETAVRPRYGRRPYNLIAWRNYLHIGGGEIEGARERFLRDGEDPELIEREYLDALNRYEGTFRAEKAWVKRTGLRPLDQKVQRLRKHFYDVRRELAETPPTTPAGAAALLDFVVSDSQDSEMEDWQNAVLAALVATLKSWGKAVQS